MQRPNAVRMNLDLFYDYRTNLVLYPQWQKFLRDRQPKTLIFWGQDDVFFTPTGGEAYLRDLPEAELHRLAAGHFAVEDKLDYIANTMIQFYNERVAPVTALPSSVSAPRRLGETPRGNFPAAWQADRSTDGHLDLQGADNRHRDP
jgi:hypothetical protein